MRFEITAKPDFSVLQDHAHAWVKSAGWHLDGTATVVDLETDSESTFKDFRDGPKVVIDVQAPRTDASVIAPRVATPSPSQTNPPRKGGCRSHGKDRESSSGNCVAEPAGRRVRPRRPR